MFAANDPPRTRTTWLRVTITLHNGTEVELRIPGAVARAIAVCEPDPGEPPSITVDRDGQRRRGRLSQLFEGER